MSHMYIYAQREQNRFFGFDAVPFRGNIRGKFFFFFSQSLTLWSELIVNRKSIQINSFDGVLYYSSAESNLSRTRNQWNCVCVCVRIDRYMQKPFEHLSIILKYLLYFVTGYYVDLISILICFASPFDISLSISVIFCPPYTSMFDVRHHFQPHSRYYFWYMVLQ